MHYKDTNLANLVYDITLKESFEEIQNYWVERIKESVYNFPNIILVIAANKSDLIGQEAFDEETARNFTQSLGAIFVISTAKKKEPITDLFIQIAKKYTGFIYIKYKDRKR